MAADQDARTSLLALADLLDKWAASIPMWSVECSAPWHDFADLRYKTENALKAKLRALPSCTLGSDPTGTHVELILAGISVRSDACIAGACRAWAAAVRRRVDSQRGLEH